MGNTNSRKLRVKSRSALPSLPNILNDTPTSASPKSGKCSTREELGMWENTALSERARRHHRKRLARIVADQWMHVARYRLIALKFRRRREKRIQRMCVTEWKNVVEERARMSKFFEKASVLCRFLVERRSFYNWKKHFHSNRVLADAFARTIHMVRCKQQLMVLAALREHSQAKIVVRRQIVKAERFHTLHMLSMCCSQWSAFVQKKHLKLQTNTKARKIWTHNLLKSALSRWKKSLLLEKVLEADSNTSKDLVPEAVVKGVDQVDNPAAEDLVLQTQILTKCFWCWYLLVSQKKVVKEHTGMCEEGSQILVVRHYERNLQRTAYDGWRQLASESQLASSVSKESLDLEALSHMKSQSETLQCHESSHLVWFNGENRNGTAVGELLKPKHCSTNSRREWTVRQNDYTTAKRELLEQMYCSTGSRRVWSSGLNDHIKAKNEIHKLMYCSKPSSREVAASWFVKALVTRFMCMWKEQVSIIKRHRQNHWYAVVHSKMQCLLKGFHALRENVDAMQSKQTLQELSVNCYNQNLKRKTVSGCKFLHQTKRVKLVRIEHATAQWRAAKLKERFQQWYFATALRSMRRSQQQKSVNFRNRQLLLHALQAWRDIKGIVREKGKLETAQLTRLRGSLTKFKKLRILRSWKSLRKEMNVKRFNEAKAMQVFIGFRTAPVVKALHVHMQEQKLKRFLLEKAIHIQNTRLCKSVIRTWSEYVFSKNLNKLAAKYRRLTLLKHAMTSLFQWHQPRVEFRDTEEEHSVPKTTDTWRRLHSFETPFKSLPVMPARAQPRRPAFLYEDVSQPRAQYVPEQQSYEDKRSSGCLTPRDPNLVAKEIEWMEQVLLDHEELKVQLVRLRAELALQVERKSPGVHNGFDQQDHKVQILQDKKKILLLQQEISTLEAKKMMQRPLIHAVLSRVQDLQVRIIPGG